MLALPSSKTGANPAYLSDAALAVLDDQRSYSSVGCLNQGAIAPVDHSHRENPRIGRRYTGGAVGPSMPAAATTTRPLRGAKEIASASALFCAPIRLTGTPWRRCPAERE